jgi:glycosyltransferase involved in cell wall biosynthesis
MRILYSHRIQSRDGQSLHVEEIVAALRAAGHEVLVIGPAFYEAASFGGESKMVALARRLLPAGLAELAELAYNFPAYRRLRRACREFAPDLLYERYNLYYLAGALLARRHALLFHLEVNSPLADERARFGKLRFKSLARALERWVWRSADRVLAVTVVLKEVIATAGVPAERLDVIPNGVALARFPPLRAPADPAFPVILGFVGFVRDWHGLDGVIRAMATEGGERINLIVVGDGPARPELERKARERGIADRVRFTGVVPHAEIPELIAGFDIALQPKVVAYASPLKIFEYMAAGRAIIAPDQPNICEILEHERTALLFGVEDGAMWQAIMQLASNAELRRRFGEAARAEIARRDYTWDGNARRIAERAQADLKNRAAPSVPARALALLQQ